MDAELKASLRKLFAAYNSSSGGGSGSGGGSTGLHTHTWADITGKPTTYPPATHNHDERYYTETEINEKRFVSYNGCVTGGYFLGGPIKPTCSDYEPSGIPTWRKLEAEDIPEHHHSEYLDKGYSYNADGPIFALPVCATSGAGVGTPRFRKLTMGDMPEQLKWAECHCYVGSRMFLAGPACGCNEGPMGFRQMEASDLPTHKHQASDIEGLSDAIGSGGGSSTTVPEHTHDQYLNKDERILWGHVLAGPTCASGAGTGKPAFRRLDGSDLPAHTHALCDISGKACANYVWAGPACSGAVAAAPTFRKLQISDLPNHTHPLEQIAGGGDCSVVKPVFGTSVLEKRYEQTLLPVFKGLLSPQTVITKTLTVNTSEITNGYNIYVKKEPIQFIAPNVGLSAINGYDIMTVKVRVCGYIKTRTGGKSECDLGKFFERDALLSAILNYGSLRGCSFPTNVCEHSIWNVFSTITEETGTSTPTTFDIKLTANTSGTTTKIIITFSSTVTNINITGIYLMPVVYNGYSRIPVA